MTLPFACPRKSCGEPIPESMRITVCPAGSHPGHPKPGEFGVCPFCACQFRVDEKGQPRKMRLQDLAEISFPEARMLIDVSRVIKAELGKIYASEDNKLAAEAVNN